MIRTATAPLLRHFWQAVTLALGLLLAPGNARSEATIHKLSPILEGHQVGGVTIDAVGDLYVADFGDIVWKITPDGRREVFASGLYGTSGNAIDAQGNLLQSSYYGDFITKIDRAGHASAFVTSGLKGPVGIAVEHGSGAVYVANCTGNTISKIAGDGTAALFAQSDLFKCPNGIALDRENNLYVVNFRDNRMLRIDQEGRVAPFAQVSAKGLGHLCFKKDRFYVAAFEAHEIYEVTLDGSVRRLLGDGQRGLRDGRGAEARLSFPNGIACDPWAPVLYIDEYVAPTEESRPRRAIIREIELSD